MLADLWHCPTPKSQDPKEQWLGTSTIGSSEACILGGLAMKRAWQESRKAEGKPIDKPNLVLGSNAQVCWHKVRPWLPLLHAAVSSSLAEQERVASWLK